MPDFSVTQNKIVALLEELRSWGPQEKRYTLHELADRFKLDIFVIDRLARSEGLRLKSGYHKLEERKPERESDPNASTLDLNPDEVKEALSKPDPSPDYVDEDADTGVWRKNSTGEWKLVRPGSSSKPKD